MIKTVNILAASVLAALSIAIQSLWFLSFFAIALFFYGLWFQIDDKKHAIFSGLLFGFSTIGASIWWVWDAIPITWIDVGSPITQWLLVFISWILVSIVLSVAPAAFSFFIWKFRNNLFIPAISILAWPLQEIGREWVFYIFTIGKQSLFGAHFSITAIGYTLAENNYLLQFADTVGIYGLDFIVALLGSVIALIAYSLLHKGKYIHTLSTVFIMLVILSIPIWNKVSYTSNDVMKFALLTADISINSDENSVLVYKKMLEEIAASENIPDVVVFPEGSGLSAIFPNKNVREEWLKNLFGDKEVLVISSNYTLDRNNKTHSLIYYDSSTRGNIAIYEKMFLMGQGEYVPYISAPLFKILKNKTVDEHLSTLGKNIEKGSEVKAVPYKNAIIGSLLCSEILSPQLYRDLVTKQGANILVNLSHTSWFNGSNSLFRKMQQMSKVHAVQNRTYFIQTSNGLPSFVLDSQGKIVLETNRGETKVVNIDIPILKK